MNGKFLIQERHPTSIHAVTLPCQEANVHQGREQLIADMLLQTGEFPRFGR